MALTALRRTRDRQLPGIVGVARVDRSARDLAKRLRPGEVAVIDHVDLDRSTAEALLAAGAAAVVNVAPSISGRYPNLGPSVLLDAGLPLVDDVGPEILGAIRDGQRVRIDGDTVYLDDRADAPTVAASGVRQTRELVDASLNEARAGLAAQVEALAATTMDYLRRDSDLLLDGAGVPRVACRMEGRPVVVVVRGPRCRDDLRALRGYIRAHRPVLVGVDGGADALRECGHPPDIVVGDLDDVADETLTGGAEVVVRAYPDGRAPGLRRARELGVDATVFPASGTAEDLALLLADVNGAALVVTAGMHATLLELLDQGSAEMASTFLTRLRVGAKLVDARAVAALHRPPARAALLAACLLIAVLLGALVAVMVAPGWHPHPGAVPDWWHDAVSWAQDRLP